VKISNVSSTFKVPGDATDYSNFGVSANFATSSAGYATTFYRISGSGVVDQGGFVFFLTLGDAFGSGDTVVNVLLHRLSQTGVTFVGLEDPSGILTNLDSGQQVSIPLPEPLRLGTVASGQLIVLKDSGSLGSVGDNELHYLVSHPTQTIDVNGSAVNVARLDFKFDTNSVAGSTAASDTISMLFVETPSAQLQLGFNDFYLITGV
jgi:hypothetical protein